MREKLKSSQQWLFKIHHFHIEHPVYYSLGGTTSSTQIGGTSKEKALPNGLFHIKGDPRILLENHQGQVRFLNLSN